jgi:hypothetical protein
MNQPTLFYNESSARLPIDITARKHRNSPESIAANPSQNAKRASYERILALLREKPLTGKEIAAAMHTETHYISGRLSELRLVLKRIEKTGIRREGSAELRIKIGAS